MILAVRTRPGRAEIGVALGVGAVYLLMFLRISIPEENTHVIEYSLLAVLIYEALLERATQGGRVPRPEILAITITALLGLLDEGNPRRSSRAASSTGSTSPSTPSLA